MTKTAKFNLGDIVTHAKLGYRAIIIDIDPLFQASGRYNPQAVKHKFATQNPWYRLLVDGSCQETYVEECQLQEDHGFRYIDSPNINLYLIQDKGQYRSRIAKH